MWKRSPHQTNQGYNYGISHILNYCVLHYNLMPEFLMITFNK